MRLQQVVGIALVSAGAVAATDLMMQSSLLRIVRPRIVAPADGAIVSAPISVSWEGPQPMEATLTGNGQRIELGLRDSPFEIDASRIVRPGQYGIELRAARFGSLISAERRFMVRRARDRPAATEEPTADEPHGEPPAPPPAGEAVDEHLQAERDELRGELAGWQAEVAKLREDNAALEQSLDELQAQTDARLAAADQERQQLAREHLLALQENQFLHQRLDAIPPCAVWGYVAYPRPQTNPPSRLVLAGDRNGAVFRSEPDCARARSVDPTGASPCVCVGPVWGGQ
jgi:hypothetical protein